MKPPTVWGIKGVRMVTPDHARLPSGARLLLERELQESDTPPIYTRNGDLRIIDTGPERLLLPRRQDPTTSTFDLGTADNAGFNPPPTTTTPPPTTPPPTTPPPTTPPPTTPPPTTPPPTTPPPTTPPPTTPPP